MVVHRTLNGIAHRKCSVVISAYLNPTNVVRNINKKAVLSQGNRAMPQLFFSI